MKPTITETLKAVQVEFEKLLETKNSWGKNEVKAAYQLAVGNALIKILDNDA